MVDEFFIYSDRLVIRSRWSFGMNTELAHPSHFRLTEHQELKLPLQESFLTK